jgi:hypothetical protein
MRSSEVARRRRCDCSLRCGARPTGSGRGCNRTRTRASKSTPVRRAVTVVGETATAADMSRTAAAPPGSCAPSSRTRAGRPHERVLTGAPGDSLMLCQRAILFATVETMRGTGIILQGENVFRTKRTITSRPTDAPRCSRPLVARPPAASTSEA